MTTILAPRPGEHCIICGGTILPNDQWQGAKGDYAHTRCMLQDESKRRMLYAKKALDKWEFEVADNDYEDPIVEDDYSSYDGEAYSRDWKDGYNQGYEQAQHDNLSRSVAEQDIKVINDILTSLGVPLVVNVVENGHGAAGRLAWFLLRQNYVIQELGNPDALKEG